MMYFRDAEDRENAVHAVTGAGSVRTYQAFDRPQSSSIPAPAPQALPAEQKASAPEPLEQKTTANPSPLRPPPLLSPLPMPALTTAKVSSASI